MKLQRDIWMPPAQEASYLKTLMRPGTHGLDLELRWDWWNIFKRAVRNRSLLPWRDLEFYKVARELSLSRSEEPDLDGYLRLFAPAHGKLTGDIAPAYGTLSVEQIRKCFPVLEGRKLFFIVRDPVPRFWSAMTRHATYRTFGRIDYNSLEAAQRLFQDPVRSIQNSPTEMLGRWDSVFGRNVVKVFYFDDVVDSPRDTFEKILDYIGSSYRYRIPLVPVSFNRKAAQRRVTPTAEAREWVRRAFQPELEACAERFGAYGQRWLALHRHPAGETEPAQRAAGRGI